VAFNLSSPKSINNLFGNWLVGVTKKEQAQIPVGTCSLLWAMWNVHDN
jgi:hypothetical protein